MTTWYIIFKNLTGSYLGLIDAINEAEALKILNQQEVVNDVVRAENMYRIIPPAERQKMIASFKLSQTQQQYK